MLLPGDIVTFDFNRVASNGVRIFWCSTLWTFPDVCIEAAQLDEQRIRNGGTVVSPETLRLIDRARMPANDFRGLDVWSSRMELEPCCIVLSRVHKKLYDEIYSGWWTCIILGSGRVGWLFDPFFLKATVSDVFAT